MKKKYHLVQPTIQQKCKNQLRTNFPKSYKETLLTPS